ncbi:transcription-associated recombination protein [Encephalitozoon romaleae SJ-2008]|uniref:Transcription-associated recombination protein n=1 Tax=Encephalitozoon romaleae (strain SJ-2008) TaxID=1178016 RepID=I6ZGU5_ENCRO|nr:transcription-associated recombination protein [Encephalitozoon romaleae SJ-2008]AFN82408.1 transcription-associated recombination protein [Encephalitozoon romaleae SJ-2008]
MGYQCRIRISPMGWVEAINSRIDAEDGEYVSRLFSKNAEMDIEQGNIDLSGVKYPFNILLEHQKAAVEKKSYGAHELLIKSTVRMVGRERWTSPIIKRVVYELLEPWGRYNPNRMSKLLADIYKKLIEQKNPAFVYVGNALFHIHLETGRFKLAEDLLMIVKEPETVCRDYYVFYYYKGIIKMYQESFKESYLALERAFGYKKWRRTMAPVYFISSLLVNKFPKDIYLKRFGCDYLSEVVSVVRGGFYMEVDDAIRSASKGVVNHNLCRIISAHCPLICFNNLVNRTYLQYGCDSRLDIQKISEALPDIDFKEIVCLLSNAIESGRLRGYISISRRVVVFSKADPFPIIVV